MTKKKIPTAGFNQTTATQTNKLPPAPNMNQTAITTSEFKPVDKPVAEEIKKEVTRKKVSFWVETEFSDKVKKIAYHKGTTVSKIMEIEIEKWLENPIPLPVDEPYNKEEVKSNGFYLSPELEKRFSDKLKEQGFKKNPILRGMYVNLKIKGV